MMSLPPKSSPAKSNPVMAVPLLFALISLISSTSAIAQTSATVDSIEYINNRTGQYYRTDVAAEIAALDQHVAVSGYSRTGQSYKLWRTQADAPSGAIPLYKISSLNFANPAQPSICSMHKSGKIGQLAGGTRCSPQTSVTYALLPDANGQCAANTEPVFQSAVANNTRFTTKLSVVQDMFDRGWNATGVTLCVPGVSTAGEADIYRLLKQATFGANDTLVNQVKQVGITAWVDNQLNMPAQSTMPNLPFYPTTRPTDCVDAGTPSTMCARDNYSFYQCSYALPKTPLTKK
ncbi:MAG: DUF1800 domain-containing protein [Gammaproteobacteria bacterium]|nr:DUF1800 domain-containing protein [Gammaproteobacteria bacterium]